MDIHRPPPASILLSIKVIVNIIIIYFTCGLGMCNIRFSGIILKQEMNEFLTREKLLEYFFISGLLKLLIFFSNKTRRIDADG